MKVLVVLCAVAACCVAKPGGLLAAIAPHATSVVSYSSTIVHPSPAVVAAPAYVAAPVPAYVAAPAPALVAAPVPRVVAAPAPVVVAAPAPAVIAAPAPVSPVVAAPAPVLAAPAPVVAAAPAVAAAVKTQYHSQDEHGQAAYGHSEPAQTHNAVQDVHGNKVGSFSYVAPNGHVLRTDYVADGAGYRVASNALPLAPVGLGHRVRRGLVQTPASTQPLVYTVPQAVYTVPAPVPAVLRAPATIAYTPAVVPAAPLVPAPAVALAAPGIRHATLTTVVNNPGHAVSYRVD